MIKRAIDVILASVGLLLLAPVMLLTAIAIRLDSPGPVFFRQVRVGLRGKEFRIYKFRTMFVTDPGRGLQITVGADPRITRVGALLRRYKLDELPQLIDVVRGTMSLVGPRPEVPKYVAIYPEKTRDLVLSVRPGITDAASLQFFDEAAMLRDSADPEATYVAEILPQKLALYESYVRGRSTATDIKILLATAGRIFTTTRHGDVRRTTDASH